VWSYAQTHDDIKEKYEMKEVFFEKLDPDDIVNSLDNPKVFAFGCYIWNCNYTDVIAQKVKEKFPECLIVYGGPQIPITAHDEWWGKHPYVDVVIYYEGEKRFTRVLQCSSKAEMSLIANVAVNLKSGWTFNLDTKAVGKDRIKDLELIPSPYTKFAEDWTNKRSCKFSNKNSPLLNHQVFPDFLSKNATLVLTAEKIVKFLNISNSNVFSIKFSISIILV
jgi:hypothetical protein